MKHLFRRTDLLDEQILLLILMLIMFEAASAYITEPLERVCTRDEELSSEVNLQPDSHFFRQRAILLEDSGSKSAVLLLAKMSYPPCSLVIEVPRDTHAIAVSLHNFPKSIPCPLSLWFHEGTGKNEAWSLDLCDREKRGLLALYPEVYPHRITLRWNPTLPKVYSRNDTRLLRILSSEESLEIVVTAVARGPLCDEDTRVLCWKMMGESLCVAEEFACDGRNNCPEPRNDESKSMCSQRSNGDSDHLRTRTNRAWDILTEHLKRILAVRQGVQEGTNFGDGDSTAKQRSDAGSQTVVGDANAEDSEGDEEEGVGGGEDGRKMPGMFGALPRLGPGSYILLGVLTCGSVLLLCGFWECCCRVRSQQSPTVSVSHRGSLITAGPTGHGATTTVVIISSTPPPPQYEDLEQPPNYKELFPATVKASAL